MSDQLKKLIWDIDKQMRIGGEYYNKFAKATQKYTLLMLQLKNLDPAAYEEYKKEMEARFGKQEETGSVGQDTTGDGSSRIVTGNEARSGEGADVSSSQLSLDLDSGSANNGGEKVWGSKLASGNEVESDS